MADSAHEAGDAVASEDEAPLTAESLATMNWPAVQQLGKAMKVIRVGMKRPEVERAILAASDKAPGASGGSSTTPPAPARAPAPEPAPASTPPGPAPASTEALVRELLARMDRLEAGHSAPREAVREAPAPVIPAELAAERHYPARRLHGERQQHEFDALLAVARLLWQARNVDDVDAADDFVGAAVDRLEARMAAVLEGDAGSWAAADAFERQAAGGDPWLRRHEPALAAARTAVAAPSAGWGRRDSAIRRTVMGGTSPTAVTR